MWERRHGIIVLYCTTTSQKQSNSNSERGSSVKGKEEQKRFARRTHRELMFKGGAKAKSVFGVEKGANPAKPFGSRFATTEVTL